MGKVIQGVIYALVLALAGLAWRLIYAHYAVAEIQHTLVDFGHQQQVIAQQQQRHWVLTAQQQHESLRLAGDERCVGGTVIRVNGSVYTQDVDMDGRAVHCEGQHRVTVR